MKHIVFCCTVPETFSFSRVLIPKLKREYGRITLVSSEGDKLKRIAESLGVEYREAPFYRGMNPWRDLIAVRKLYLVLRELKPDILIGATPKASLISMVAGKMAGVSRRIYHIYGLPYETAKGIRQKMLFAVERITGSCATHVVTIASSVKESTLNHRLFASRKMHQRGFLTIGGVDINRFNPESLKEEGVKLRHEWNIPDDAFVIGYVARFTYDKGFCDLIDIWNRVRHHNNMYLLVVGKMDERVPLPHGLVERFFSDERVCNLGFRSDVERCFSAMDMFLFPSYREGFGNVSIEASAMGVPVVTYDVTGCRDAVENNVTGFVVPFKDYDALEHKIEDLYSNHELRLSLGEKGRARVCKFFSDEIVAHNFLQTIKSEIL